MFNKLNQSASSLKEKAAQIAESGAKVKENLNTKTGSIMQASAEKLDEVKKFTEEKTAQVTESGSQAWGKYGPEVEYLLAEGLLTIAEDKLSDNQTVEAVFYKAYEMLPLAVRLVLSRELFLKFSIARRDAILEKVQLKLDEQRSAQKNQDLPSEA